MSSTEPTPSQIEETIMEAGKAGKAVLEIESAIRPDAPNLLTKYATIKEAESFGSRVWHGFLAGITSTTAIKAEKSLAVTVLTRIVIAVGGGVEAVKFVRPAVAYIFRAVGLG